MINLIPHDAQKAVKREYIARVCAVWAFIIALAISISAVLLLPTYVLLSRQISVKVVASEERESTEAEYSALTQELAKASALAAQLRVHETAIMPSEIVAAIEKARSAQVSLTTINVGEGNKKMLNSVSIAGIAKTRGDLRAFIDTLKQNPLFTNAEVPVSDLARDSNLSFTATLTVRTP